MGSTSTDTKRSRHVGIVLSHKAPPHMRGSHEPFSVFVFFAAKVSAEDGLTIHQGRLGRQVLCEFYLQHRHEMLFL